MASVDKDPSRRKTPYVVRWRDESGRQRKRGFARKLDADRFRAEVEHRLHSGTYVDQNAGRQTFRQYAETWRLAQPHAPNTAANTKSRLERHIYPAIGSRPLSAIRTSELQAFVTGLRLAPNSVRCVWGTLTAVFNSALRDRLIGYSPCVGVKLPEVVDRRVVPLSEDQVDALVRAMPDRYKALVWFDAGTGLRQGEVFGVCLRDDDGPVVDLARRTLRVVRQIQPRRSGGGVEVCRLKNRKSYRTVPLADAVVQVVSRHIAQYPPVEVEIDDCTDRKNPVRRKFLLLFTDRRGRPLVRENFNVSVWRPACDRAADILRERASREPDAERAAGLLQQASAMADVTQHDLRHYFASALIRSGLNVKVVAERLGHANALMTLNVYAHLWPDDADRSRQAIDDALGGLVCPQSAHGEERV